MGVRGLTTFVATRGSHCLSPHELHGCTLVVDGSSIAAQLFLRHQGPQDAFGGDYRRFANKVCQLFVLLRRCHVRALVVMDGGYERRKLRTVKQRMIQRWQGAANASPANVCNNTYLFPPMLKDTFKAVLAELGVALVQSLFEADAVVAALARRLQCPVLSFDSDFFVYGVMYIPFPSLATSPSRGEGNNLHLRCSMYTMEQLVEGFGGLQSELIPLVAVLLGNDFISNSVFKTFVKNLKHTKGRHQRRAKNIEALLRWLRTETLESATAKVVGCFPMTKRRVIAADMQRTIEAYQDSSGVEAEQALGQLAALLGIDLPLPPNSCPGQMAQGWEGEAMAEALPDAGSCAEGKGEVDEDEEDEREVDEEEDEGEVDEEEDEGEVDEDEEDEGELDGEDEEDEWAVDDEDGEGDVEGDGGSWSVCGLRKSLSAREERRASKLPPWFLDCFQRGLFPSSFMDIYVLQVYFSPPLVEDVSEPPAHTTAAKIVSVIMCLLLCGDSTKRVNFKVRWFTRGGRRGMRCVAANGIREMSPPPLRSLPLLSLRARERLLLVAVSAAGVRHRRALRSLPPRWRLFCAACRAFAVALVAPAPAADVASAPQATVAAAVDALLLTLFALDVQAPHRQTCEEGDEWKGGLDDSQAAAGGDSDSSSDQEEEGGDERKGADLEELLGRLSADEKAFARQKLSPLFLVEEQLKTRPKMWCAPAVHLVACFQSAFLHLRHLNSLVRRPWPDLSPQRAVCATASYNALRRLQRLDAAARVAWVAQLLLPGAPHLLALFFALRSALARVLAPELLLEAPLAPTPTSVEGGGGKSSRRKQKKKKKKLLQTTSPVALSPSSPPAVEEEGGGGGEYDDAANRFAALAVSGD